ncbi:MAG: zinc ribbon domain-containing protein [Candidatus Saelkia tenebricola]|nr:zinc ribbon domain-containing protein [Candidatus Saelkia tenebricola]
MPIYTYLCKECGEKFDLLVGVISKESELKCRKCNSKKIEKILSEFSVGNHSNKSGSFGGSCPTGTCNL